MTSHSIQLRKEKFESRGFVILKTPDVYHNNQKLRVKCGKCDKESVTSTPFCGNCKKIKENLYRSNLVDNSIELPDDYSEYIKFSVDHECCYETFPCQHPVYFTYKDGSVVTDTLSSPEIKKLYELCGISTPPHYSDAYELI